MGDVPALKGVEFVNLEPWMVDDLVEVELACFPMANPEELFSAEVIRAYAETFPEGYFVAVVDGRPVGMGAGIYLDFDFENPQHSIIEITGANQCGNHNPQGAWYYGTDLTVHPDFQRRGVGRSLYELRKGLVMSDNKKGIIAGASIPGFYPYLQTLNASTYVEKVVSGELHDTTLSFQLANGFEVRGLLENYVDDPSDGGWAALIVWENPRYRE